MADLMGDFVDFADIENQIYRREMDRIYEFNIMLVGRTGVGKSTLVKSLFQGMIKPESENGEPKLNVYSELLEENGVKLRLCCIETSNYDKHDCKAYKEYIVEQLKNYFKAQRRQSAWNIRDTRVHCCLYLIPPYRKMILHKDDIACMKELHEHVNLIPVIANADSFDLTQIAKFKENIIHELEKNEVKYFEFRYDDKEDDERCKTVKTLSERFPFAIVAADEPTVEDKKSRWIRQTLGGPIDILDSSKCDFDALAKLLIRHCMLDLIDSTHERHYANYKTEVLAEAQKNRSRNLRDMGLEWRDIKRIEELMSVKAR